MSLINNLDTVGFDVLALEDSVVGIALKDTWNAKMADDLTQKLIELEQSCRGIVLYGAGEDFSKGLEQELLTDADAGSFQKLGDVLLGYSKPTLALLHGQALGIGYEVAMCCDKQHVVSTGANTGFNVTGQRQSVIVGGFSNAVVNVYKESRTPASLDMVPQFKTLLNNACFSKPAEFEIISDLEKQRELQFAQEAVKGLKVSSKDVSEISCMGTTGIAALEIMLLNMVEGKFISQEAFEKAKRLAVIISGGEVPRGTVMTYDKFAALEKATFI